MRDESGDAAVDPRTLVIDGARVHGIHSFFDEINRVFMADESWDLGASLDALDDMLYGGYGAASGDGPVTIVWTDAAHSRAALGLEATRAYYREKLAHPQTFDTARFTRQLAELEAGTGPSYFDTVLAIFASHPRLRLVLEEGAAAEAGTASAPGRAEGDGARGARRPRDAVSGDQLG